MPFTLEKATPDYAAAIANVFLGDEADEFLRLQFGTVDPAIMSEGMTERLTENIKKPGEVYVVARDEATGEIVSYCSWTLPRGEDEPYVRQSADVGIAIRSFGCNADCWWTGRRKLLRLKRIAASSSRA